MAKKKKHSEKINTAEEFNFFELDENNLVEEWINQPRMYFKYSELLTAAKEEAARCVARVEIAQDELKEVKAKLDIFLRKNTTKIFGKDSKPTENAIANRIMIHVKYKAAKTEIYKLGEELIKANSEVSTYYSAVHTLDHRKSALERLVSLHGQNYFSVPQAVDSVSKETIDGQQKRHVRSKGRRKD